MYFVLIFTYIFIILSMASGEENLETVEDTLPQPPLCGKLEVAKVPIKKKLGPSLENPCPLSKELEDDTIIIPENEGSPLSMSGMDNYLVTFGNIEDEEDSFIEEGDSPSTLLFPINIIADLSDIKIPLSAQTLWNNQAAWIYREISKRYKPLISPTITSTSMVRRFDKYINISKEFFANIEAFSFIITQSYINQFQRNKPHITFNEIKNLFNLEKEITLTKHKGFYMYYLSIPFGCIEIVLKFFPI